MPAKTIILWMYYFTIGLLLIALPFSYYMMSVSQFGLVIVFILDGIRLEEWNNFKKSGTLAYRILLFVPIGLLWIARSLGRKFKAFFHQENAPAWVFSSIFLFHLLGLIYTSDFHYALKDLRIKFPIFLLPLVLSTTCLVDRRSFRALMILFISAVFVATLISSFVYLNGIITDIRKISIYISHIRFSLLIDMTIFIVIYMVIKNNIPFWLKIALAAIGLWLVAFLVIFAFMTGLIILIVTAVILVFYMAMSRPGLVVKLSVLAGVVIIFVVSWIYIRNISKDVNKINPVDFKTLDQKTSQGNFYRNDTLATQLENGNYVYLYISEAELKEAWEQRSRMDYNGTDKAGQELRHTLIRFLTSKGYRKDAEGVGKLTGEEIALIEEGIASTVYVEKPLLYVRIYKIFWEYKRYTVTHNPSGHSVMQRFEYWRTSWALIRENWLIGVGTGDLNNAFQEQYEKMDSKLEQEFRWRAHNQYLAIFVSFGLAGLLWFIFSLVFPALWLVKFNDYYYLSFFLIFALSMLTEDTLETQAGVTQFVFFTSFYLFSKKFIDII